MNKKNARIEKLLKRGITDPAQIAKKLGLKGPEGVARVIEGVKWIETHQ